MANYRCAVRTNYFRVKDEDAFRELMGRVYGTEDTVHLWEEKLDDGQTMFGFGCYGEISGIRNAAADEDDDADTAFDEFVEELQKCVADDDAIIIFESGNEKLRYLVGSATVITSNSYRYMDIRDVAVACAGGLLGNPEFTTKTSY